MTPTTSSSTFAAIDAARCATFCAAGCGVFAESYATVGSVGQVVPVDLVIKGCPPKPIDLVKGLLALMEQATAKAVP